ncbi:MAG: hypothetical protein ACFFKA_10600 [Candidatus Thorarchaeota archaeon]
MVEATIVEIKQEEIITLPEFDVESKENIDQYFKLLLAGTPKLKFSITNKNGQDIYSKLLNVEMR